MAHRVYDSVKGIVLSPDQMKHLEKLGAPVYLESPFAWFKYSDDSEEEYKLCVTKEQLNYYERIFAWTVQDMLNIMTCSYLIEDEKFYIQILIDNNSSECCLKNIFEYTVDFSSSQVNLIDTVYECFCKTLKKGKLVYKGYP